MNLTHVFAGLAVAGSIGLAGTAQATPIAQYGFDFTTGDVASNGGVVNDDSGNANDGLTMTGNGGAYSADIPTIGVQNATGIGSVAFDGTNSIGTDPAGAFSGAGIVTHTDIINAGGLTVEVWIKGSAGSGGTTNVATVAGLYGLTYHTDDDEIRAINGLTAADDVTATLDDSEWTHVAAVYSNPTGAAGNINLDIELFINGGSQGTTAASNVFLDLGRGFGVGNHTLANSAVDIPYTGSVYEPVVYLGALGPGSFVTYVPEPASIALLGLGGLMMLRRRRA